MANKVFVYTNPDREIIISEQTSRERGETRWELLRLFQTIQVAREWVGKNYPNSTIRDMVKRKHTGISPAGRIAMREKKLGSKNPNAKGLTTEHRHRIQATMKGTRIGTRNPMWGMKHRASSRLKTSLTLKTTLPRRRWCVDDKGVEHMVTLSFVLPKGWQWGRNTLKKWERTPRKHPKKD